MMTPRLAAGLHEFRIAVRQPVARVPKLHPLRLLDRYQLGAPLHGQGDSEDEREDEAAVDDRRSP